MWVGFKRVVLVGVLSLVMIVGNVAAVAQTGGGFTDDNGNIHEQDIEFILDAGITLGCNPPVNDNYCPSLPVSRAQLASFMARAFDLPAATTDYFTDDQGSVHEADINRIAAAGYVFGCGTGLYCPEDTVTRAQLASVFVRAFSLPNSFIDRFVDDDTSVHEEDINALAEAGVTKGCGEDPDIYCPFDPVLRDQFASFMARALRLPTNEPPVADADSLVTPEDTPISILITGVDPDADALTYSITALPNNGTLTGTAPNLDYTPDLNFNGTDTFEFVVNDGTVSSDPATVTIFVDPINDEPVLAAIGDQTGAELVELSFTAAASDVDVPADGLTYTLDATSIAAGMTIDPATGAFAWTPTEAQGPAVYTVTVTVTDDGTPNLEDLETFDISVTEVNVAPQLASLSDQSIDEESLLSFTASATDADDPANDLTYTLDATSVGAGMAVDSGSGEFTWTPTEAQGPGVFSVTLTVVDDGTPVLDDSDTFDITVGEVNLAPELAPIGDRAAAEGSELSFTASASDADLPANGLTFTLDATSIAASMTIDPVSGAFAWTPTEAQSPGVFSVTVTVADDGVPGLDDAETFDITVTDTNTQPVLDPIGDQTIDELDTLTFTATASDADLPADDLAFSLDATAIAAGMGIESVTGAFSWTPTEAQGPGVYPVTVTVTDDGSPNLADSETINVTVAELNVAPVASAQAYAALGNVGIVVPGANGLLTDATDADLPAQTLSIGTFDATTAQGGAVTAVDTDTGAFTYTPAVGFAGTDTFTYTVVDDGVGTLSSVAATVTITVADVMWFVDNSASGSDSGTLVDPFQTVAALNGSANVDPGDHIYLAATASDYTTGPVLSAGQTFTGQGATGASFPSVIGVTVPAHTPTLPSIGGASPRIVVSGNGFSLAADNEIRGVDVTTNGGPGFSGTAVGALVIDDVATLASNGAAALQISNGSGVDLDIDSVAVVASPSGGVVLSNLTGTTNLGSVDILTSGGTGLSADNAGTLNIAGVSNTITSTGGSAVVLTGGTLIDPSGLTFRSINATAGPTGIVLSNTGTGAFSVTGDGPSSSADNTRGRVVAGSGTGGTITATTGDSVQLTNASNVVLRNMVLTNDGLGSRRGISMNGGAALVVDNTRISGFSDDGVYAADVTNLDLTHVEIESNAKSVDAVVNDESNVTLTDVGGLVTIADSLIRDVSQDNVRVSSCELGPCPASLALAVDNVAIRDTSPGGGGNDGILIRSYGTADVTLTVIGSEFTNNRANGVQHNTNDASSGATNVSGSTFYGSTVEINIAHQGASHLFVLDGNTIRNQLGVVPHNGNAINVFLAGLSGGGSLLSGTISNNSVGDPGIADSGSILGQGIELFASGQGTLTSNVTGNTVHGFQLGSAFRAISSSHTGIFNVTAKTNTFDVFPSSSGFALAGLELTAGTVGSDTGTMCADITGNTTFRGDPTWAGASITTAAGSPTLELVGYGGADNDAGAIATFLNSAASLVSPPANVGVLLLAAGTTTGRVAPCPLP